jgi:spore maturation protein A
MLNYIWGGLIVLSFAFALVSDFSDLARDTYRNERPLPIAVDMPDGYDPAAKRVPVTVRLDSATVARHYGEGLALAPTFEGTLLQTDEGRQLRFGKDADLPEPLATIRSVTSERDNDLRGPVAFQAAPGDTALAATVTFSPVRFVKLRAITAAAFDFAETAVTIALGLIGVLALWLGLLRIAEKAGLIDSLSRFTAPVIRRLFPGIPADHPALGMIVLSMTANMLGLGNAATPLGIKAMEEMQTLNPDPDTATDDQVMFLAINTASVQLVPPVLLIAVLGLEVNRLIVPILLVTFLSLVVAIVAARRFSRMRRFRQDPPASSATPVPAPDPAV